LALVFASIKQSGDDLCGIIDTVEIISAMLLIPHGNSLFIEYLGKYEALKALTHQSGAWVGLTDEKTKGRKSRDTVHHI
jgi:hypothetical protein